MSLYSRMINYYLNGPQVYRCEFEYNSNIYANYSYFTEVSKIKAL